MNTTVAPATTPALRPAGRERTCAQCSTSYRAPRASSRFCSDRCKKRTQRGSQKEMGGASAALRNWLTGRGYAGKLSPWDERNRKCLRERHGLTVPLAFVLDELNATRAAITARGLRPVLPSYTEATLKSALSAAGLEAR